MGGRSQDQVVSAITDLLKTRPDLSQEFIKSFVKPYVRNDSEATISETTPLLDLESQQGQHVQVLSGTRSTRSRILKVCGIIAGILVVAVGLFTYFFDSVWHIFK